MRYTKDIVIQSFLAIVVAVCLPYVTQNREVALGLALALLLIVSCRYGFSRSLIPAVIFGVAVGFTYSQYFTTDVALSIVIYILTGVAVVASGLFARNMHRTLNNRRFSSYALNSVTSIGLSSAVFGIVDLLTNIYDSLLIVVYAGVGLVLLLGYSWKVPKFLLTKRSPFLSNKERSKLLND